MSSSFAVFALLSFALMGLSFIVVGISLIFMPDFILDSVWNRLYLIFLPVFGSVLVSAIISFLLPGGLQRKIGNMFSCLLNGLLN